MQEPLTIEEVRTLWGLVMGTPLPKLTAIEALTMMENHNPNRLSFEVGALRDPSRYLTLVDSQSMPAQP